LVILRAAKDANLQDALLAFTLLMLPSQVVNYPLDVVPLKYPMTVKRVNCLIPREAERVSRSNETGQAP
jgi:hypothetical protein